MLWRPLQQLQAPFSNLASVGLLFHGRGAIAYRAGNLSNANTAVATRTCLGTESRAFIRTE